MKIVVPHMRLRDETIAAIREYARPGDDIHLVHVGDHDEQLYELWLELWAAREDVIVIEHDIVIHDQVLPSFATCPEPWCSFGYTYAHFGVYHGTGCVRVRAALMAACPDAILRAGEHTNQQHPPRHWCSLDAFVQYELARAGRYQHRHEPPVEHLGVGVAHACVTAPA